MNHEFPTLSTPCLAANQFTATTPGLVPWCSWCLGGELFVLCPSDFVSWCSWCLGSEVFMPQSACICVICGSSRNWQSAIENRQSAITQCHTVALAKNDFYETNPFDSYNEQNKVQPSAACDRVLPSLHPRCQVWRSTSLPGRQRSVKAGLRCDAPQALSEGSTYEKTNLTWWADRWVRDGVRALVDGRHTLRPSRRSKRTPTARNDQKENTHDPGKPFDFVKVKENPAGIHEHVPLWQRE